MYGGFLSVGIYVWWCGGNRSDSTPKSGSERDWRKKKKREREKIVMNHECFHLQIVLNSVCFGGWAIISPLILWGSTYSNCVSVLCISHFLLKSKYHDSDWRGKNLFGEYNFNIKYYLFGLFPNTSYTLKLFGSI